jgi:chromosome partitioning protein
MSNRPDRKPPILLVAASKGGAGKSTIAVHLTTLASKTRPVVLVDLDGQRSASSWGRRRRTDAPQLVEADPHQLASVQTEAGRRGAGLLVVDTAPRLDLRPLVKLAAFVAIPTRPGALDLEAVGRSVGEVASSKGRGAIVLNAVPPGRGGREAAIVREARAVLAGSPIPLAPMSVGLRASLAHALIEGQAVHEFEPDGKAAQEIESLWKWIQKEMER